MDLIQNYDEDDIQDNTMPTKAPYVIPGLMLNDEINDISAVNSSDEDDIDDGDIDDDDASIRDEEDKKQTIIDEEEEMIDDEDDDFDSKYEKLANGKDKIIEIEFDKNKHIQQLTFNEMTRIIININDMINNNVLQLAPTDNKIDFIYNIIVEDKFDMVIRRPIDTLTVLRVNLSQLKINKDKLRQKLMRLF